MSIFCRYFTKCAESETQNNDEKQTRRIIMRNKPLITNNVQPNLTKPPLTARVHLHVKRTSLIMYL